MLSQKTLSKPLVLAAVIVAAATVLAALPGRDFTESAFAIQQATNKGEGGNKMPRALYSAQLPNDPAERAMRVARSGRYDKRHTVPFDETSPDTTGRTEINDWYLHMSALPAAESDVVVIGEVTSEIGYLSNDRTGAYSEFTVQIENVLKDDARQSVRSITAVREGADVQLPSGRVIKYHILHQGMPVAGSRYVFFLKYDEEGKHYAILTAYELRKNRVLPLDEVEPFIGYRESEEGTFLNLVREAMAHSPNKRRLNQ